MNWAYLWLRLKAVPAGVYAAVSCAFAILFMYLRGRRLEAELSQARLLTEAATAALAGAKSEGAAQVHLENAALHGARADALQEHVLKMIELGAEEQTHIAALPASEVTAAFLKLAQRTKEK